MAITWSHFASGNSAMVAVCLDTSIVDQDVEPVRAFRPVLTTRPAIWSGFDRSAPSNTTRRPVAAISSFNPAITAGVAEAVEHDVGTRCRQRFGDAEADPARGAGHQRHLTLQTHSDLLAGAARACRPRFGSHAACAARSVKFYRRAWRCRRNATGVGTLVDRHTFQEAQSG